MTLVYNSENEYESLMLKNAARAIKTHRGEFYPKKDYGSNLYAVSKEPWEIYALCAARRALIYEDGIYPVRAEKTDSGYEFTVLLNGNERQVSVSL